jgi:hypothetical protein
MDCPRCRTALSVFPDEPGSQCPLCSGWFIPGSAVDVAVFAEAPDAAQSEGLFCPDDESVMRTIDFGDSAVDVCRQCHGVWLDAGESLETPSDPTGGDVTEKCVPPAAALSALSRYLIYSVSLPERIVRSSVGLAAGAATEAAVLLVPQSFKSAKTYEIIVTKSLRFLTSEIGGVENKTAAGDEVAQDDFMARKAVGNFVDLAGLATLHVSPVWVLAIVSDIAYGAGSYVQELAAELQKQGLIDSDATIHNVEDILKAVQDSSGNAASLFDTPPLSVAQLRETLNATRASLQSADVASILPEAELRKLWAEMRDVAARDDISLLGVSGAVSMGMLNRAKTVSQGTLTGVLVVGGLFNRHVVSYYRDSLNTIVERGFYETLRETSEPYIAAVWHNFGSDRGTWTEELLSGRAVRRGFEKLTGWLWTPNPVETSDSDASEFDQSGNAMLAAELISEMSDGELLDSVIPDFHESLESDFSGDSGGGDSGGGDSGGGE